MKQSTIKWHLARDNQLKLARFCEANKVRSHQELYTLTNEFGSYFQMTYIFNNGGYIVAELRHGDDKGYSVADHFQVVDYGLGV